MTNLFTPTQLTQIEFDLTRHIPHDQVGGVVSAYTERLQAHIRCVQEFGRRMGIDSNQLDAHDKSKWALDEFVPYALRFCSRLPHEKTDKLFATAWLNHLHRNPHHWQHWIFPQGYSLPHAGMEGSVLPMPICYAAEMIADWHGAQYAYKGDWDIQEWLWKTMPTITVHSHTAAFLRGALDSLGYADTVYMQRFAND